MNSYTYRLACPDACRAHADRHTGNSVVFSSVQGSEALGIDGASQIPHCVLAFGGGGWGLGG